jgi:hypothetical protein
MRQGNLKAKNRRAKAGETGHYIGVDPVSGSGANTVKILSLSNNKAPSRKKFSRWGHFRIVMAIVKTENYLRFPGRFRHPPDLGAAYTFTNRSAVARHRYETVEWPQSPGSLRVPSTIKVIPAGVHSRPGAHVDGHDAVQRFLPSPVPGQP